MKGSPFQIYGVRAKYCVAACVGVLLALAPLLSGTAAGQTDEQAERPEQVVIFVLDLSGSMNEPFDTGRTKLDVVKEAFVEAFTNVSPDAFVGLRVYGDQLPARAPAGREQNCTEDSRLVVPITKLEREQLIAEVQGFDALGDTAIGLALRQAESDIPVDAVGTILLFSDGRDECFDADLDGDAASGPSFGEDPCEVAKDIGGDGADLKIDRVITVGFRADAAAELELRCIADSTGGSYTAIETPEDARTVLPELLAEISSPREAGRLGGNEIVGTPDATDAPEFPRLDTAGAGDGRYRDTIEMNTEKWYHVSEFGPDAGTFTATVFGLPAQEGINVGMRLYLPESDRIFFDDNVDTDAGLPRRPTASVRCPECLVPGGPHEAYWIIGLWTQSPSLGGTYDLELLTEGPGFGGTSTSCDEPQECWYEQQIIDRTAELAEIQISHDESIGELAAPEVLAERDALIDEVATLQQAADERSAEADELVARVQTAPAKGSSIMLPLLLALVGVVVAGVSFLRKKKPDAVPENDGDEQPVRQDEVVTAAAQGAQPAQPVEAQGAQPAQPVEAQAADVAPPAEPVEARGAQVAQPAEPVEAQGAQVAQPAQPVKPKAAEPAQVAAAAPPGWHPDPLDSSQFRWWSGEQWTEHTSAQGNPGQ